MTKDVEISLQRFSRYINNVRLTRETEIGYCEDQNASWRLDQLMIHKEVSKRMLKEVTRVWSRRQSVCYKSHFWSHSMVIVMTVNSIVQCHFHCDWKEKGMSVIWFALIQMNYLHTSVWELTVVNRVIVTIKWLCYWCTGRYPLWVMIRDSLFD